ncbi:MAG: GNAT family N-acetyltransferase [Oscillospiraceae bacterium]
MDISLRKATGSDSAIIAAYLKKLAEFEKLSEYCNITGSQICDLMNEENGLNALIVENNNVPIGIMTYYFYKIATFSGKRVLYIEDVFIDPEYRRCGAGKMLFDTIKEIGNEQHCSRLEWKCLDWNTPAQAFYEKIGGKCDKDEWLTYTINL